MKNKYKSTVKKSKTFEQSYLQSYLFGYNLNEFIWRITLNIFYNDIKAELIKERIWPKDIEIKLTFTNCNELDLYIYFKEDGEEKAHFTMHLSGMEYSKNKTGPYHIRFKKFIKIKDYPLKNAYSIIKIDNYEENNKVDINYINKIVLN